MFITNKIKFVIIFKLFLKYKESLQKPIFKFEIPNLFDYLYHICYLNYYYKSLFILRGQFKI